MKCRLCRMLWMIIKYPFIFWDPAGAKLKALVGILALGIIGLYILLVRVAGHITVSVCPEGYFLEYFESPLNTLNYMTIGAIVLAILIVLILLVITLVRIIRKFATGIGNAWRAAKEEIK